MLLVVSQAALLEAVQLQPAEGVVVTVKVLEELPEPTVAVGGDGTPVQGGGFCNTVCVADQPVPVTVMMPVREPGPGLAEKL